MAQSAPPEKANGLRKMRRVATGVLAGLAAVYTGTHFVDAPGTGTLLVRAMAEAGMIGGLADWFAVEALFRRPLGLPIPHTALLPANQRRAAENVGQFFDTYFMDPKLLREKLSEIDPAQRLATWLAHPANAAFISQHLTYIVTKMLKTGLVAQLAPKSSDFLKSTLLSALDSDDLSGHISTLLKQSLHGEILDELLQRIQVAIDGNREKVVELVHERSRWWIAASVDEKIAEVLVDGVISIVEELASGESSLRTDFEASIAAMIDGFQKDGTLSAYIEQGKARFVEADAFSDVITRLMTATQDRMIDTIEQDPEGFTRALAMPLQSFAARFLEDEALHEELSAKLIDVFEQVLTRARPAISAYVTQTISDWDAKDLVERFESAVGRDLQFIRINGAILGSLIGGALFAFERLVF